MVPTRLKEHWRVAGVHDLSRLALESMHEGEMNLADSRPGWTETSQRLIMLITYLITSLDANRGVNAEKVGGGELKVDKFQRTPREPRCSLELPLSRDLQFKCACLKAGLQTRRLGV